MAVEHFSKDQCGVGTACYGCGRRLPLRMAQVGEEASLWECIHCQTSFAGVLSPEVLRMLSRRVRLAPLHFDMEHAEPLTDAVLQVVWRNASKSQRDAFRDVRRSRRISGQREVIAICLDERFRIMEAPINGVVANLSRHGQMLVTTQPLEVAGRADAISKCAANDSIGRPRRVDALSRRRLLRFRRRLRRPVRAVELRLMRIVCRYGAWRHTTRSRSFSNRSAKKPTTRGAMCDA